MKRGEERASSAPPNVHVQAVKTNASGFAPPGPSPMTGQRGKPEDELLRILDDIRDDFDDNVCELTDQDVTDLMNIIVRKNEDGALNDHKKYDTETDVPYRAAYMLRGSSPNVVQVGALYKADENLYTLWTDTLLGRVAKSNVNAMLGSELKNLLAEAKNIYLSEDEYDRLRLVHSSNAANLSLRPCKRYRRATCKHDNECVFMRV